MRSIIFVMIKNLLNGIASAFTSGHNCLCCESELPDILKMRLCHNCAAGLQRISGNICKKCGDVSPFVDSSTCPLCKDKHYRFFSNHSLYYYSGTAAQLIKHLKYDGKKYIAKFMAELMARETEVFSGVDYLTFVPISAKHRRMRGYNQARGIALQISKLVGIELIDVFVKIKETKSQASLLKEERDRNLRGAMDIKGEFSAKLKGKRVLVIDDVFTTGATLDECARLLKAQGTKQVVTFTFAKTEIPLT